MECSSKKNNERKLQYDAKKLPLNMLRNVWDYESSIRGNMRTNILSNYHFVQNSYLRMHEHLAVQVVSNIIVRSIEDYVDKCGGKKVINI